MNRLRLIVVFVSIIGAIAGVLFTVENEVREVREHLQDINHQIMADREAIHVMQAEWAYLTQPERIAALAKENMPELAPQQSMQYYSEKSAVIALDRVQKNAEAAAIEP